MEWTHLILHIVSKQIMIIIDSEFDLICMRNIYFRCGFGRLCNAWWSRWPRSDSFLEYFKWKMFITWNKKKTYEPASLTFTFSPYLFARVKNIFHIYWFCLKLKLVSIECIVIRIESFSLSSMIISYCYHHILFRDWFKFFERFLRFVCANWRKVS